MAQGLRPHYHQYYVYGIEKYPDRVKGCMVKKVIYRCMIPGCKHEYHERYEYKPPPRKQKSCKALERNKKKYSNHK